MTTAIEAILTHNVTQKERRKLGESLLMADPTQSNVAIGKQVGVDESCVCRWRKALIAEGKLERQEFHFRQDGSKYPTKERTIMQREQDLADTYSPDKKRGWVYAIDDAVS